jgi:hypothetical protein
LVDFIAVETIESIAQRSCGNWTGRLECLHTYTAVRLAEARPFDDAGRKTATAKGDGVVGLLMWIRRGLYAIATYLGLDTAADQAGVQLPQNLLDLRKVIDPLDIAMVCGRQVRARHCPVHRRRRHRQLGDP